MELLQQFLDQAEWPLASAFLLGLMTAISPCPLATNITAIGYIGRELQNRHRVLLNGVLYTLGRMIAYSGLGLTLYFGASTFEVASLFRGWGEKLLGPLLIVVGLILLDIVPLSFSGFGGFTETLRKHNAASSYLGVLLMGVLFALAFCPYSAVLYFGMLIPLTLSSPQGLWLPPVYALATGLPVIVFAWIVAYAIGSVGRVYDRIRSFERWFRRISAVLFVASGIYLAVSTWL
ncbi:MAG: aromatic aminobenezylarsenical efflux permease ArsG family transporter [Methylicorpusculum sp.]|uniref:aromatic aminobenezylarsenical efflux permease ArsG family transporter n=1 Tax=Methylicorpusculum sp. TaxID=2713644 RepID=UPI00271D6C25|nr:aromatic aminobenezylarsenical efflux permease ArsG family transporter [Methylicorpusculum sp.]MDO8937524.1 aromatic aminobenezylarsenical efflux permease ArsG family transporter [Methylicorpusculum sp.]MDO9239649.1 aromatic aminobenezylarsenical efflux permease ArsG family transporter [Methylicorpusculum sp.]MDP2204621.1 aromatic aminobenezylarsenical efflux permease ArsG family transporter [Methylicorpusculum sp.]